MGQPPVDNPWEQPGEYVVDADGSFRLACRYQSCEDSPDPNRVRTAIRRAED